MGHSIPEKKVLGWDLDTIAHLLRLPPTRQEKVAAALVAITQEARTTYLRKWRKILGQIQSITPAISGSRVLFSRVQYSLKRSVGRHVQLTSDVHDELEAWPELVRSLANSPTHLCKLETLPCRGLEQRMHWDQECEGVMLSK